MTPVHAYAAMETGGALQPFTYEFGVLDRIEVEIDVENSVPCHSDQWMLEFCARHRMEPITETLAMEDCNAGIQHLGDGRARYRVVLTR